MWAFIRTFFATLLALITFVVLLFLLFALALSGLQKKDITPVADKTILKLNFDSPILEREYDNPFEDINLPISAPSHMGLIEIRETIKTAGRDENIKGIYLNVTSLQAGIATIEEIRKSLIDFKATGKFIYAYSEVFSEGAYYLASVADSIYLNPSGLLELNGLESEITFFKGTLEKLDLKPEIFKVGNYKSAVEPLFLDKMSPANREQTLSFLQSIQNTLYNNISVSRKIPIEKLNLISDSMLIRKATDGVKYGLVDRVAYYDEVEDMMKRKLELDSTEEIKFIGYRKYADKRSTDDEDDKRVSSKNKIAVIIAQGDIQSGRGDEETIGSDKITEELRKARNDKDVKAIVLRINSPGGSSMASDVMWREVLLASKEKPVIASMGDVAASGGYYMAMAAHKIVAQPNTITGSIGVFGVLLNAQDFFKNKLGVTFDGVKTGKFADLGTIARPLTEYEKKVIQKEVEDIYTDFVQKAANGRHRNFNDIDKVASGRVWTGQQAKEIGLVDELGDFNKAVELAANEAKLGTDYEIEYRPKQRDFFDRLMNDADDKIEALFNNSSPTYMLEKTYQQLVKKYNGIQARLPFDFKIR